MPNRTSLLIRGRSRRCVPLRVPLGGLQTRCTVQQSLSLEEEEQTLCILAHPWQQKPCMRQLALVPRDESLLLLLAAFERPLLWDRCRAVAADPRRTSAGTRMPLEASGRSLRSERSL